MNTLQKTIYHSLYKLFRPLVKILLKHGISYAECTELLKLSYVEVADSDFTLEGRKQSTARVSVLTGLHRKEVSRLKKQLTEEALDITPLNRATRVIGGWLSDQLFLDTERNPVELVFDGEGASFAALVKKYSGDMPTRAVLDELLHSGAVQVNEQGSIALCNPGYAPCDDDEQQLQVLGISVRDFLNTFSHNLNNRPENSRLQLSVAYDNLSADAVRQFKALSKTESHRLLTQLNQWLAELDQDNNPNEQPEPRFRAGLGIYYFEEEVTQENNHEK